MLDRGNRALVHIDIYIHPIARLGQYFGLDIGIVATLLHVLTLQFQLHTFQGRTLEYLTHCQAGTFQAVEQGFGLNRLVTLDIDFADAGSFGHNHYQHIAVPPDADVVKITGGEQSPGCGSHRSLVHHIAHRHRQRGKNTASRDALQSLNTNIRDNERLGRGQRCHQDEDQSQ